MQNKIASDHKNLNELIQAKTAELSAATRSRKKLDATALVTISSVISSCGEDMESLENFQKIHQLLDKKQLCGIPVPGDGSCAIHAVLALQSSKPFVESEMDSAWQNQAIQSVRDEMARLWACASSHPVWNAIYQTMSDTFDDFDATEEEAGEKVKRTKKEHVKKELQEVATPNKKRRVFEDVVDLCSPERESVKKELIHTPQRKKNVPDMVNVITPPAVEKVQGARGAMRKAADPSTMSSANAKMSAALLPESAPAPKKKNPKVSKAAQRLIRKQQAAKKRKRRQKVQQEEKGDDATAAPPSPSAEPRRVRRMQRRELTMDERKFTVVGHYLASLGMTWPASQKFHHSFPVDENAFLCEKNSGWLEMKKRLANRQPPQCLTCLAQLKSRGFDEEKLDGLLSECENETCGESPWTKLKRSMESHDIETPTTSTTTSQDLVLANQDPEEVAPDPISPQVLEEIRKMKCLEVLLPGTEGKSRPVVCRACTSRQQPQGRLFDMTDQASRSDRRGPLNFLKQHCLSNEHLANVKGWLKRQSKQPEAVGEEAEQEKTVSMVKCEGFSLTHASHGRRAQFSKEVVLWASHTNLASSLCQNSYHWNMNKQEMVIFHQDCLKVASSASKFTGSRPICANCLKSDRSQNSLKNALRFCAKHWMARLLEARLFRSDEDIRQLERDLKPQLFTDCLLVERG